MSRISVAELVRRLTKDPKNPGSTPVGVESGWVDSCRGTGVPEGPEVDSYPNSSGQLGVGTGQSLREI